MVFQVLAAPSAGSQLAFLKKGAETAYTDTLTWQGAGKTDPSGSTNNYYWWQQVGELVTLGIRLEYSVAGANLTGVDIDLPAAVPAPKDITGVSNGEVIINGAALMTTTITTSGASGRCALFKQTGATNGYRVQLLGFTAGAYLGVFANVTYLANTSL